jgi:hypothetical protein
VFAVLLVPAYVVWSRGWRGILWVTLHAVLWYVVAIAVMNGVGVWVFGEKWFRA